jgi:hypothetical protein
LTAMPTMNSAIIAVEMRKTSPSVVKVFKRDRRDCVSLTGFLVGAPEFAN